MAIKYPDTLESNNPQAYPIVKSKQVGGHRQVTSVSDLYTLPDSTLSDSGSNLNSDAIGQTWYVVGESSDYKLTDWTNRKNINGWTKIVNVNSSVDTLTNDLNTEINNRTNADNTLQGNIDTVQNQVTGIINSKGIANGIATLDSNGTVPSTQLPSFVDDIIEVSSYANLPTTGETGKIYVTLDTNLTYRWSGTVWTEVSKSLALGETSSTAYSGDKGKSVRDDLDSHTSNTNNPHSVSATQISITGYTVGSDTVISSSDTVLTAIEKLQGQKNAVTNSLNDHKNNTSNPHSVNASQVEMTGYAVGSGTIGTSDSVSTAIGKLQGQVNTNATTAADNLTEHTNNTSNPHSVNASQVNLTGYSASSGTVSASDSVSSGISKIVGNLTNHINNTSNPHSVTKSQVGLGNVDNTSDLNKPISTATQTALNNLDTEFSEGISNFTQTVDTYGEVSATVLNDINNRIDGITVNEISAVDGNINITKSDIGLGNVDNTSDANKPISTATQTAITAVQTNLDNLNIGGRNLLGGTKSNYFSLNYSSILDGTYKDFSVITKDNISGTSYFDVDYIESSQYNYVGEVLPNETYTLSFWCKKYSSSTVDYFESYFYNSSSNCVAKSVTSQGNSFTDIDGRSIIYPTNDWVKYYIIRTINSTGSGTKRVLISRIPIGMKLSICGVKLERGNRATDWTPAPEDKQDLLTFDSTPTSGSTNPVTSGGVYTSLSGKQNNLTFDSTPTSTSGNPVTSDGIYTSLNTKVDKVSGSSLVSDSKVSSYDSHLVNVSNPHSVTKSQIGLGNVDNTSDATKSVLKATNDSDGNAINTTYVKHRDNGWCYNDVASAYFDEYFTSGSYIRIDLGVCSVYRMLKLDISLKTNFLQGNSVKLMICIEHNDSTGDWAYFSTSVFGLGSKSITVFASDRRYVYILGAFGYPVISIDKMLVGDAATSLDLSTVTIDSVTSLPTTYQTSTMVYGLDSNNFNTYSPTLTGTGASGSWGINITGSAAKLTTARTLAISGGVTGTATSFDGSANITIPVTSIDESYVGYYNGSISLRNYLCSYINNQSSLTGIIKITYPVGWTSSMHGLEIDIYEYNSNGLSKILIYGYNYSNGYWVSGSVSILGNYNKGVRLSYDGAYCCILLGTTSTVWSYPRVIVRKALFSSTFPDKVGGFTTSLITDETGYTSTVTPTINSGMIVQSARQLSGSPTINGVVFNGTSNILINPTETKLTSEDLNSIVTPGFYYAASGNTVTNKPTGSDAFGLIVYNISLSYIQQDLIECNGNIQKRWTRYYNGSWSDWKYIYTQEYPQDGSTVLLTGYTHTGTGTVSISSSDTVNSAISTVQTELENNDVEYSGSSETLDSNTKTNEEVLVNTINEMKALIEKLQDRVAVLEAK